MPFLPRHFLCLLLPWAGAYATDTQLATNQPIINFRLMNYTTDGFHAWLARGSEAQVTGDNQFDVKELNLTVFTGLADEKVETMILSPGARVQPAEALIFGDGTIRVINDEFEATGTGWRYDHKAKKVSIARNVRVTFRAELKAFLK